MTTATQQSSVIDGTITVPKLKEHIGLLATNMGIEAKDFAAKMQPPVVLSKAKKAELERIFISMNRVQEGRLQLVNQIAALGGTADVTMTREALSAVLSSLTPASDESSAAVENTQEESVMTQEQTVAPEVQKEVPQFVTYESQEYVHVDYTKTLIEQAIYRTQQEVNAVRDQELAIIAKKVDEAAVAPKAEAPKATTPEAPKAEVTAAAPEMTDAKRAELIKALEAELKELEGKKAKAITGNHNVFLAIVDQYRAVEAKLLELKGGNVEKLVKEKYNGFRTAAGATLHKGADVTEKYGHAGVARGSELLNSIFSSVMGVTKDVVALTEKTGQAAISVTTEVGHAGVDLTAGTLRATGDFVGTEKK